MPVLTIRSTGPSSAQVIAGGAAIDVTLDAPLTPAHAAEIRWYIEEYRALAYGADSARAQRVEASLLEIGTHLFEMLFRPDPARALYAAASTNGPERLALSFESDDPTFLARPWELLHDGTAFLASRAVSFTRRLTGAPAHAAERPARTPLRVLLVVARPTTAGAVPLRTVAASLASIALQDHTNLAVELLRPPTFLNLAKRLSAGEPVDILHFDGHGVYPAIGDLQSASKAAQGHLLFETTKNSRADPIAAEDFAALIHSDNPPLVLLNACNSGREGADLPFSSVAAHLARRGVPGVLAMGHSIRVDAVEVFMRSLYHALEAGRSLPSSVAAARRDLLAFRTTHPDRQDWFVPLLYSSPPNDLDQAPPAPGAPAQLHAPIQRLFGREPQVLELERALILGHRTFHISGALGVGQSEFARLFADWFTHSGGAPAQRVINVDGLSFDDAVAKTSQALACPPAAIAERLRDESIVLVWDNAERLLSQRRALETLSAWASTLAGSHAALLVASSGPDLRLTGITPVRLRDISNEEATRRTFAALPMPAIIDLARADLLTRIYEACHYHSRTLDLALSEALMNRAADAISTFETASDPAAARLIDPRIPAAFDALPADARAILPIFGFFGSTVNPDAACILTENNVNGVAFDAIFGRVVTGAELRSALAAAARLGLCESLWDGRFDIPPDVRLYLRTTLAHANPGASLSLRNAVPYLYAGLAHVFMGEHRQTPGVTLAEETGFIHAVRVACTPPISEGNARCSRSILRALTIAWTESGFWSNLEQLAESLFRSLPAPFPANEHERLLWSELRRCLAIHANLSGDPARTLEIDRANSAALSGLTSVDAAWYRADSLTRLIAAAMHDGNLRHARELLADLDSIAQAPELSEFKSVITYWRTRLDPPGGTPTDDAPSPDAPLSADAAREFEQHGLRARADGNFPRAYLLFSSAYRTWVVLKRIGEAANARSLMADCMVSLGMLAEALAEYHKVLAAQEHTGQHGRAANTVVLIAQTLEQLGRLDEARKWCDSAVPPLERLGMQLEIGHVRHEQAIIEVQVQGDNPGDAWLTPLTAAIEIYKNLGAAKYEASSLFLLAQLQAREGNGAAAWEALKRSIELDPEPESQEVAQGRKQLLELLTQA